MVRARQAEIEAGKVKVGSCEVKRFGGSLFFLRCLDIFF